MGIYAISKLTYAHGNYPWQITNARRRLAYIPGRGTGGGRGTCNMCVYNYPAS